MGMALGTLAIIFIIAMTVLSKASNKSFSKIKNYVLKNI